MFVEIKTYKFTCDCCGKEEIKQDTWFHRPAGWSNIIHANPHGMSNYDKDICPECATKKMNRSK